MKVRLGNVRIPRMPWQMMDKLKSAKRILICPVDKHSVNDDKSQREFLEASTSADF